MKTCPTWASGVRAPAYAPFCSKRCADVDLQRWFTGAYAIPASAEPSPPEADDPHDPA